ncbi:Ca-activated chloride channel family protein [Jannaschia faecimaris]|uniref:Ca-activated chloride channel family protein n=1 Tax=Jannaschia faecimaris TaxID=1244108 RepID=A0A1H3TVE6_9RHOB|nr:VWA domain-containing protein [Jannaschia faecimaris]SDZ53209.1 Ca-activated chloride channel family protein [Jannaschia faecimaris]
MKSLALALTCALALPAAAQGPCATDAMIVFDGSASMAEIGFDTGETNRITDARAAMARVMPEVEHSRRIGLITYGPGAKDACEGISLRFPPIEAAAKLMIAELDALEPAGLTPLVAAVQRAADVLDYRLNPGIIVLVTDGNETCGGRPCALGRALTATAADLTVHVIGYKASHDFFGWNNPEGGAPGTDVVARCLADTTGGRYIGTHSEYELVEALWSMLGCEFVAGSQPVGHPSKM